MYKARYCPYCKENGTTANLPNFKYPFYYFGYYETNEDIKCKYCKQLLSKMNLTNDEFSIIIKISCDSSFIEAMDDLKQKDPIEFNLKMSQFKSQISQTQAQQNNNKNILHCPKCNSTAITTGARGVNNFWGMLGASKTVNRCGNCGFTWKP